MRASGYGGQGRQGWERGGFGRVEFEFFDQVERSQSEAFGGCLELGEVGLFKGSDFDVVLEVVEEVL